MANKSILNMYSFHDSLVNDIIFDEKELKLIVYIELCNWMQKDYTANKPELRKGVIEFYNVFDYYYEPNVLNFDNDEIILLESIPIENSFEEQIKIVLRGTLDVKVITFRTSKVKIMFDSI